MKLTKFIITSITLCGLILFVTPTESLAQKDIPTSNFEEFRNIENEEKKSSSSIAVDNDFVYVVGHDFDEDFISNTPISSNIKIFYKNNGTLFKTLDHRVTDENLAYPQDMTVYNGLIYVADTGNHRIIVFDKEGSVVHERYHRSTPQGIDVYDDLIYVTSPSNVVDIYSLDLSSLVDQIYVGEPALPLFFYKQNIDVDENHIYVTDYFESRVNVFDKNKTPIAIIGEGTGRHFEPRHIQRFDDVGNAIFYEYDALVEEKSTFYNPEGLVVYQGLIYVTDTDHGTIKIFDQNWRQINTISTFGSVHLDEFSEGIEVYDDKIYVSDTMHNRIQILNLDGTPMDQIITEGSSIILKRPSALAVHNDLMYVNDISSGHMVQVIDPTSGRFIKNIGFYEDVFGGGDWANSLAVDDDFVYVLGIPNDHIQVFDHDGKNIAMFNLREELDQTSYSPIKIAAHDNTLYVINSDFKTGHIQVFDHLGKFMFSLGQKIITELTSNSIFDSQIRNPRDVTISNDMVYVLDVHNENPIVKIYSLDGDIFFGAYPLMGADAKTISDIEVQGSYVFGLDMDSDKVMVFDNMGMFVTEFGGFCDMDYSHVPVSNSGLDGKGCRDPDGDGPLKVGDGQFFDPYSIAIKDNTIFVSDMGNDRIQGFIPVIVPDIRPDPPESEERSITENTKNKQKMEKSVQLEWPLVSKVSSKEEQYHIINQPLPTKTISDILDEYISIAVKADQKIKEIPLNIIPDENPFQPSNPLKNDDTRIELESKSIKTQDRHNNEELSIQSVALFMLIIPVIGATSYFLLKKRSSEANKLKNK